VKIERNKSPPKSQVVQKTNTVEKTPISPSSVVSPPSQSSIPIIRSQSSLNQVLTSPKNSNTKSGVTINDFEVKSTAQVFDVVRKGVTSPAVEK
jgi:hypothetical protein